MERNEAIEVVKKNWPDSRYTQLLEALETLIPELAESEDERIRKYLIWVVNNVLDNITGLKLSEEQTKELINNFSGIKVSDILAYLEKQKEPHFTKRNALFDECVENCDPEVMKKVSDEVDEILEKEQKPISQEDFDTAKHEALWGEQKPIPANSVGLKEQKPEWSEEDEKMLRTIISDGSRGVELDSKQISWLKSLRPSWKPSEEQMKALEDAFRKDGSDEYRKTINSLYQDLKKLM